MQRPPGRGPALATQQSVAARDHREVHHRSHGLAHAYDADVFDAARHGDMGAIEDCIREGLRRGYPAHVVLAAREPLLNQSPLHFAAEGGHLDMCKVGALALLRLVILVLFMFLPQLPGTCYC